MSNRPKPRHRRSLARVWASVTLMLIAATGVSAQESGNEGRFRLGPLRFTPSITLTNVGIDTNVFNDAENPKRDKTATIGPAVGLWLHVGPSRLTGNVSSQYVYFAKYKTQRSVNTGSMAKWDVPLGRLTPYVEGSYAKTKSRPNYEIEARVGQTGKSVGLGTEIRLSGRTTVVVSGKRGRTTFDDDAVYLGEDLANALNSTTDSQMLQFRYKLTSLTTFALTGEAAQDHFGVDNLRNSNSIRLLSGFELKPAALIAGNVFVGFRDFRPLDPVLPPSRGLFVAVDATLTARATRLNVRVGRDVAYSFRPTAPYYTLTDVGLSLTQRFTRSWDVVVRGSRQTLDYTQVASEPAVAPPPDETGALGERPAPGPVPPSGPELDTIRQYGGGIGYRFGHTLRLGLDVMYNRRSASIDSRRDYQGLRAGASVTYGLQQ